MAKRNKGRKPSMRNLLHDHPLLRKCDVHDKEHKAKRRKQKVKLQKEWFDQSAIGDCISMKLLAGVTQLVEWWSSKPQARVRASSPAPHLKHCW